ncbi:MAG: tryptophan--tRNA ligase [Planctomycetota bacterium]
MTIANYIGAIRNWVKLQDEYDCVFSLVDLHCLTVRQDPEDLRRRCYDFLALYIACGIDPDRSIIFMQSHVPTHAELTWVLGCYTYMGELSRMTQFKEKARKRRGSVNAGLLNYPLLMAADILLYQTDLVPVGEDQKQHLEITRDIAQRFNSTCGETFRVPEIYLPPVGARIRSLQEPERKMDKSDEDEWNYIALLDEPDTVRAKVKKAVTDSGRELVYDEGTRPAISNLMAIHSALTGGSYEDLAERYAGKGYAQFKADLVEVVIDTLRPIQARYRDFREDEGEMKSILKCGAEAALERSRRTLEVVYERVGLIPVSE